MARAQERCLPDDLLQSLRAKPRQQRAHLLRDSSKEVFNHLRLPRETSAQGFILSCDTDRTRIRVALPSHHAADGQKRRGAETKFIGAEQGGEDDITRILESSIHAKANLTT